MKMINDHTMNKKAIASSISKNTNTKKKKINLILAQRKVSEKLGNAEKMLNSIHSHYLH